MIEIIAIILWVCFTAYAIWYFTSAKHYAPITPNEARLLWKIHKQTAKCNSKKWREIRRGRKIIGFACECGYKYMQKRPIVTGSPQQAMAQPSTVIIKNCIKHNRNSESTLTDLS